MILSRCIYIPGTGILCSWRRRRCRRWPYPWYRYSLHVGKHVEWHRCWMHLFWLATETEEEDSEDLAPKRKPWGDTRHFCPVALTESGVLWPGNQETAVKLALYVWVLMEFVVSYVHRSHKFLFITAVKDLRLLWPVIIHLLYTYPYTLEYWLILNCTPALPSGCSYCTPSYSLAVAAVA